MKFYEFPCGCRFEVLQESTNPDVLPLLNFDADNIREDCVATWQMIGEGKTQGVFQLESKLGKQWAKKLKPESMQHIAALSALLRPGCLRAVDEHGISMTQHYARRKNFEEPVTPYHPEIDKCLANTFNVMTYQEQSMAIAVAVAGFSLVDADSLRKSIGKKLAEDMAKCKIMFMEGAKKAGILTDEQAIEVFDWIEKSQRYAFNASHAFSYGITGYQTAYIKHHFPVAFFTAWLAFAKEKQDPHQEVYDLVNDAKLFSVDVRPPDIRSLKPDFHTDGTIVRFGITNVKGVGNAQVEKLKVAIEKATEIIKKPIEQWTWFEFLVHCASSISSNIMTALVKVGALSWLNVNRNQMLFEYDKWNQLTDKEQEWVQVQCGMEPPVKVEKVVDPNAPVKEKKPRKPREPKTKSVAMLVAEAKIEQKREDKLTDEEISGIGECELNEPKQDDLDPNRQLAEQQASRLAADIGEGGWDDHQTKLHELLLSGRTYDDITALVAQYSNLKSNILLIEEETDGPASDEMYAELEPLEELLNGIV